MSRRILKFTVAPTTQTPIQTADTPRWLAVGAQGTNVVAWCEATPGEGVTTFLVARLTGQNAQREGGPPADYIGTAEQADGIVVHVYVWVRPDDGWQQDDGIQTDPYTEGLVRP